MSAKKKTKALAPAPSGGEPAAPTSWRAPKTALGRAAARLRDALVDYSDRAPIGTIACILDPLEYAWDHHLAYIERYGPPGGPPEPAESPLRGLDRSGERSLRRRDTLIEDAAEPRLEAVLLGMNPGPFGMAQTGVPFGSPDLVRDFLKISGPVNQPRRCHPERPIDGFDGKRTEVSGQRLWGGVRDCFGAPEPFFRRFFVINYCPLVLQSESGANVTPDKAPADFMAPCFEACDAHLADALKILRPRTVIGVGKWAEQRAKRVIETAGLDARVASILHPSPASPAANRGWLPVVRGQLEAIGHAWPAPRG